MQWKNMNKKSKHAIFPHFWERSRVRQQMWRTWHMVQEHKSSYTDYSIWSSSESPSSHKFTSPTFTTSVAVYQVSLDTKWKLKEALSWTTKCLWEIKIQTRMLLWFESSVKKAVICDLFLCGIKFPVSLNVWTLSCLSLTVHAGWEWCGSRTLTVASKVWGNESILSIMDAAAAERTTRELLLNRQSGEQPRLELGHRKHHVSLCCQLHTHTLVPASSRISTRFCTRAVPCPPQVHYFCSAWAAVVQ